MPAFNPFREDRLRRIRELLGVLERQKEIELDYILGWGGLHWGSTEPSIMSMLLQLEKARMIDIIRSTESHLPSKIKYIGPKTEETKKKKERT